MQQPSRSAWPRLLLAGVAAAIVLLSFLVPLVRGYMARRAAASERERAGEPTAGSPTLGFSIRRGDKVVRGTSGDLVYPGDRIRFTYSSERPAQFALLRGSQDRARIDFPRGSMTVPLPAARDAALDIEVELDKLAGTERVFGLFCEAPVVLEPLRTSVQKEGDLPKLPGCRMDVLTLQKKLQ
jgi:hypothetical protein